MKRLLLFSTASTLLLAAMPAYAASNTSWDTSDQCKTVLALDAVSPYVQKILDRADSGLQNAYASGIDDDFILMPWAKSVEAAWAKRIDTQLRLTTQSDDLASNTACLRFDMLSIECKMDQVRHQMNEQLDKGSFLAILKLANLLEFLDNRYLQLASGADDPEYTDTAWKRVKNFDDVTATFDNPMCPYNSDYGPPLQNGYGCDLDVLDSRKSFQPLGREYDALKVISDQLEDHRQAAAQFLTVQQQIDALFQTESQTPDPPAPRSHINLNGCNTEITTKTRPATTELRGPFALEKKQLMLLIDFFVQRVQQGNSRQYKDSLKTADEFSSDQTEEKAAREKDAYFGAVLRGTTRVLYSTWSRIQGGREASAFAVGTDPSQEVATALSPLRASVGSLARLTELKPEDTEHPTLRSFIIKYATFLLRSCVYRPCTQSLEQILKITFANECFPYTNGDFLTDSPGNPRSEACKNGAGLTVP